MMIRDDLRAALPGWVLGRLLTALGWLVALVLVRMNAGGTWTVQMHQGLFAWDGAFYRAIADVGYEAVGADATRFHPLLPMLGGHDLGLLIVSNLVALCAAAAIHHLVLEVLRDPDLARRAATLVGVAAPAFTLVWAYAESLFLFATALLLLALHRRQWWWVAVFGVVATLARPTGLLLVVAVAVGLFTHRSPTDPALPRDGHHVAQAAALVGPGLVMVGWLWWVEETFGDAWLPLRVQGDLRGGTRFPPFRLVEGLGEAMADPLGDGLHLPFALLALWLAWIAWRRLPLAWALYAAVTVLVMLSASNLNSIERYAFGNVVLIVAGASVAGGRAWRPTVGVSGAVLVGMTALAWYGRYVP
ncbi:MAG: hypothetical protein WD691_05880 [Acidimicrobiales bacterium]